MNYGHMCDFIIFKDIYGNNDSIVTFLINNDKKSKPIIYNNHLLHNLKMLIRSENQFEHLEKQIFIENECFDNNKQIISDQYLFALYLYKKYNTNFIYNEISNIKNPNILSNEVHMTTQIQIQNEYNIQQNVEKEQNISTQMYKYLDKYIDICIENSIIIDDYLIDSSEFIIDKFNINEITNNEITNDMKYYGYFIKYCKSNLIDCSEMCMYNMIKYIMSYDINKYYFFVHYKNNAKKKALILGSLDLINFIHMNIKEKDTNEKDITLFNINNYEIIFYKSNNKIIIKYEYNINEINSILNENSKLNNIVNFIKNKKLYFEKDLLNFTV
jgi:hypothetical protein